MAPAGPVSSPARVPTGTGRAGIAHAPQGFWPLLNRGELAALYCFVFLYLCAAGGGPWSMDQWLWRGTRSP